jgi:hypothetical protein
VLRVALVIVFVLGFAIGSSHAQSEPPHGPPPRLERPAPYLPQRLLPFTPNVAAGIRLQALGASLTDLAQRERKRFWPAAMQLAVAAGFGTAAVFVEDPGLRAAFSLSSAVIGARSIIEFAVHAHAPQLAADFAGITPINKAALFRKLRVGELGLASAARVGRRKRILQGCLGAIGAVAYLPVTYVIARREDDSYRFGNSSGDYVGLSLAVIGLAASLVRGIRNSVAEQYYADYRKLRRVTAPLATEPLPGR